MGATTCKNCSLTTLLDKTSELDLKIEVVHEVKSPTQVKSFESLRNIVPMLKALWQGYSMRKLYLHLLRQSRPNHLYFSKSEVFETLSPTRIELTKKYGNFSYQKGGVYIGEWMGGFRHGYGAMIWPDGAKYEGSWSYGRPLGSGKFIHVDGELYNGRWTKYWVFPRDIFGSGGNLENMKENATDGFLWLWIKHELFKTEPPEQRKSPISIPKKNPKPSNEQIRSIKAKAEFFVKKVNELKIEFKNISCVDNKSFKQYRFENGVIYIGCWKDGKREGYGKQIWTSGDVYEGEWQSDKQSGLGKQVWSTGNAYFGEFDSDNKEGLGEYKWKDGSFYLGEWKRNKMHGVGKHKWDDGKEYIGEWVAGAREGVGVMLYKNGSMYQGHFMHDRPHGFGVLNEAEGRVLKGNWENGKFIEPVFM